MITSFIITYPVTLPMRAPTVQGIGHAYIKSMTHFRGVAIYVVLYLITCQGLFQSKRMGKAPTHAPTRVEQKAM